MYDITAVRAIVKNRDLCTRLSLAASDEEAESILTQSEQVINNTVAALKRAGTPVTPYASVTPTVTDYDAGIGSFISSIAGHSASLTPEVVKETLSKHPDWSTAYEEALAKGGNSGQMYLMGNLDLISELFNYI